MTGCGLTELGARFLLLEQQLANFEQQVLGLSSVAA